jgi:hypothetical protein
MKQRVISTWYFEQDLEFGGSYPQNSGPAYTESFRDTYRRCIYIFFASAKESNPDARLVLFLNATWSTNASKVSKEVEERLIQLGVEIIVIPFTFGTSPTTNLWKNQFFVLDAIKYAYTNWCSNNLLLILDSDIIWNPHVDSEKFWAELLEFGLLTYEVPYTDSDVINGLSRRDLTTISQEIEQRNTTIIPYLGGEFIAFDMSYIEGIFLRIQKDYAAHLSRIARELPTFTEEAHFLSHIFSVLGYPHHDASHFIKRIWTMFRKFQNSDESDMSLLLLHVPAEKNYGIRRLYKMSLKDRKFAEIFSYDVIGIPQNSFIKILRDSSWAIIRRVRKRIIIPH